MSEPILPTKIIPAGEPLPAPAAPPPPPPRPPAAPPPPVPDPDRWRGSGSSGPPPVIVIHNHNYPANPADGRLSVPDPQPGPRWWQRIRIGYNAALATLALSLAGPWAHVLDSVQEEESLAGAWVMALGPLIVIALADNAYRVAAAAADELWLPKLRAALARFLLWAAVIGTCLALPVTTLVYALTGVQP